MKEFFKSIMYAGYAVGFIYSAIYFYNTTGVGRFSSVLGIVIDTAAGLLFTVGIFIKFFTKENITENKSQKSLMNIVYGILPFTAFIMAIINYYIGMDISFGVVSFIIAAISGIILFVLIIKNNSSGQ